MTPPAFIAGPGGGNTVENAPLLTPGVTVSGNTAADNDISHNLNSDAACTKDEELWTLNLIAGDNVTLKGADEAPGVKRLPRPGGPARDQRRHTDGHSSNPGRG